MKPQVIPDSQGNAAGVYIPMDKWNLIKTAYPDVEQVDEEIPDWQKLLLDERLEKIAKNPNSIKPIQELFAELDSEE